MTRITRVLDVDFHQIRSDGRLIVRQEPVPIYSGMHVIAREIAEDMEFTGTVTGCSEDGTKLYLTMDWE